MCRCGSVIGSGKPATQSNPLDVAATIKAKSKPFVWAWTMLLLTRQQKSIDKMKAYWAKVLLDSSK